MVVTKKRLCMERFFDNLYRGNRQSVRDQPESKMARISFQISYEQFIRRLRPKKGLRQGVQIIH